MKKGLNRDFIEKFYGNRKIDIDAVHVNNVGEIREKEIEFPKDLIERMTERLGKDFDLGFNDVGHLCLPLAYIIKKEGFPLLLAP